MPGDAAHMSEPKLILLALGAGAVLVLCILAIIGTTPSGSRAHRRGHRAIGLGIVADLRGVIAESGRRAGARAAAARPRRGRVHRADDRAAGARRALRDRPSTARSCSSRRRASAATG